MYAEHTLMISGSEKGIDALASFLRQSGCGNVVITTDSSQARRLLQQMQFELIVINTPLQEEFGYALACRLSETTTAGIILICKAELVDEMIRRTMQYGVCIVPKPLTKPVLLQAVRTGAAFYHRVMTLSHENQKLRAKLDETRYVSNAKLLLMTSDEKMSEEEAHRYIEKQAMDTRRTKKEVAQEIIKKLDKK